MARHRSPGGRCTVPAYSPEPDARWPESSSLEATTLIATVPQPGGRHHRPEAKPLIRGNTLVGATVALGAVVTGSFIAVNPTSSTTADAAETSLTPTDLATTTQPLVVQPASSGALVSDTALDSATGSTALLPVAVPADRVASTDQRDVELLHKAGQLAAEAAAGHAAAEQTAAKESLVMGGGGKLDDWISVALVKLDLPQSMEPGLRKIIMKESRGNPKAINRTDSNALAGRPSQGLMQTIPSTFRAYVLPELAHLPITNPVANITAGVRYMIANYGLSTLKAGGRSSSSGGYIGY